MRKLLVLIAPVLFSLTAFAQSIPYSTAVNITVDELGRGSLTNANGFISGLSFSLQQDPGPGGPANVPTYDLLNPPGLTSGDVRLLEGSLPLDTLRFNPNGTLVFYSEKFIDFIDSLADVVSSPQEFYSNVITIPEIGTEDFNFALYTPTTGQPGFVAGAGGPVTYMFISDGTAPPPVPEPSSFVLLGTGLAGFAGVLRRRFSRNA